MGVTIYSTVPAAALPGLMSVWLMLEPVPALAPVMLPVIVPIVQLNVLAVLAVNGIAGLVPLQISKAAAVVTTGVGFTVMVMVYGAPGQAGVAMEVGVTIYWTVPVALLLGLFSVCAIVAPVPAVAPVIPPLIDPMVQANVLGTVAARVILVAVALQMVAVFAVVTAGVGLTVTVMVYGLPGHAGVAVDVGVTMY